MNEQLSELVAVKLDDGWFLSKRKGDPSNGLVVSDRRGSSTHQCRRGIASGLQDSVLSHQKLQLFWRG